MATSLLVRRAASVAGPSRQLLLSPAVAPLRGLATPSSAPPKPKTSKRRTVFKGLSILKDQPDPVAKPDEEYPAWLWSLLDEPKTVDAQAARQEGGREMDFERERKRLRAQNRANIKASNYLKTT